MSDPDRPPQLLCYRPGTLVQIGPGIDAVVVAVVISGESGKVVYTCEWWNDRELKSGYFDGFQVEAAEESPRMMRVWF